MSKISKLKVEIETPEHGWTHIKLSAENSFYEFFPSDVPIDSINELVKALLEISSGGNKAKVYWNDEPVEHNFVFSCEDEKCVFKVYEIFELISGRNLIERFSFSGIIYDVLRPFWKALSDMKSKQSLEEYEKHWGNSFPANEMFEIKQKLQNLRNEYF